MPKMLTRRATRKAESKVATPSSLRIPVRKFLTQSFKLETLAAHDMGLKLQQLDISFNMMEHVMHPSRGTDTANVIKCTPNLRKLTLGFGGHMHSYEECLGPPLMAALCALKDLEQFTHRATTTVRTEFGLHSLLRLAAAWPKLRVLHIAGDLETSHDVASLPPVTCKLQRVTLEACTANLEDLALLFAASSKSLKTLEMWTMAPGSLDAPIACVLPGLEVLRLGGCGHPSLAFIRDKLGAAPRLRTLQLGGGPDRTGRVRAALTTAMSDPALFCWLRQLEYPALALPEVEKAKPGKGKGKEKENALGMDGVNVGEAALLAVAAKRKIRASRAVDLEYTGEGGLRHSAEKWHKRAAAKKR